jgi:hypothetical protein
VSVEKSNLPDDLCHPDGFLGEFVDHLNSTAEYRCPEFFLAAALCLLSVVTGRKVQDYRGTRTNIFCVVCGPSGAGKDHTRKAIRQILKDTPLEGPEAFTSATALTLALEESPALLCQMDELGMFLKGACSEKAPAHLAGLIKATMTAFTSPDSFWKPSGYASRERNIGIEQPHLVVHGTTTPEAFFDALNGTHVASGFMGRLLVFTSPEMGYVEQQDFELSQPPDSVLDFVNGWISSPYDGNLNTHFRDVPTLSIAPEALERLKEHFRQIATKRIGEDPLRAAIWSRASEKTSKLALLHTISRGDKCTSLASADWAVSVSNQLTRRLVGLIGANVADSEHHRRVQKVLRIVKDAGIVSLADLSRKTQWLALRDRREIISQLIESGTLIDVFRDSKTRPARGLTADITTLRGSGWQPTTPEILERIRAGDLSKSKP